METKNQIETYEKPYLTQFSVVRLAQRAKSMGGGEKMAEGTESSNKTVAGIEDNMDMITYSSLGNQGPSMH